MCGGTQSVHNKCSALPLSFLLLKQGHLRRDFQPHPKRRKAGLHFCIHNCKLQKALKTKTPFLSLPLPHLVTKPARNEWEMMYVLVHSGYLGSAGCGSACSPSRC